MSTLALEHKGLWESAKDGIAETLKWTPQKIGEAVMTTTREIWEALTGIH